MRKSNVDDVSREAAQMLKNFETRLSFQSLKQFRSLKTALDREIKQKDLSGMKETLSQMHELSQE